MITARSAMHPGKDEDIVHTIAKNRSYGVCDKGLIALARRSSTIKTIAAEPVYENDIFEVQLGVGRNLSHKLDLKKERGEVVGYYCLVELENGGVQFKVLSKKDIELHRDKFSKAFNKNDPENIWNKNFDAMALKTCVIQALKLCPISIEALEAVSKEEQNDIKVEDSDFTVVDYNENPQKEEVETVEVVKKETVKKLETIETPGLSPEEEIEAKKAFNSFTGEIF